MTQRVQWHEPAEIGRRDEPKQTPAQPDIAAKGLLNCRQRGACGGLHQRPAHGVVTHAQTNLAHRFDRTEMRTLKGMASDRVAAAGELRRIDRLGNQGQTAACQAGSQRML